MSIEPITSVEMLINAIVENAGTTEITAVSRIELFLTDILMGRVSEIPPITRIEMYLAAISGADVDPPDPITRVEMFLAKIAGQDVELVEAVLMPHAPGVARVVAAHLHVAGVPVAAAHLELVLEFVGGVAGGGVAQAKGLHVAHLDTQIHQIGHKVGYEDDHHHFAHHEDGRGEGVFYRVFRLQPCRRKGKAGVRPASRE